MRLLFLATVFVAAVAHQEPADDMTQLGESKSVVSASESSNLQGATSNVPLNEHDGLLQKGGDDAASLRDLVDKHQQKQVVGESVATGSKKPFVATPMTASAIKKGGKIVAIMSARNNQICGLGGSLGQTMKCSHGTELAREPGHFFIVENHGGKVAFKPIGWGPIHERGLIVSDRGGSVAGARHVSAWEKFDVVDKQGKIALKSGKSSKYCANEGTRIKCNRNYVGSWEKFIVIPIADYGDPVTMESRLKSYLPDAFAAEAKSYNVEKAAQIGMSYEWCQKNERYGTKRATKRVTTQRHAVTIQWGSRGPTTTMSMFMGIRWGVHRIENQDGRPVLLCSLWASVCGPLARTLLRNIGICGTSRLILGCKNPEKNPGWTNDCINNDWEVPFA